MNKENQKEKNKKEILRQININEPQTTKFISNTIKTAKYNM